MDCNSRFPLHIELKDHDVMARPPCGETQIAALHSYLIWKCPFIKIYNYFMLINRSTNQFNRKSSLNFGRIKQCWLYLAKYPYSACYDGCWSWLYLAKYPYSACYDGCWSWLYLAKYPYSACYDGCWSWLYLAKYPYSACCDGCWIVPKEVGEGEITRGGVGVDW